jgi:hypothetical protein
VAIIFDEIAVKNPPINPNTPGKNPEGVEFLTLYDGAF